MRIRILAAAAAVAALAAAGCTGEPEVKGAPAPGPGKGTAPAPAEGLPTSLRLAAAPAGAEPVAAAKKKAKEGDTVTLRGRIAGSSEPFVDGRAVMTIADLSLKACNENEGDTCPAPWDFCCESHETITANTVTVEVDGPDGKALRAPLQGWNGLKPLRTVVVVGTVGPRPDPAVLVVRATGIFVE